MYAVEAADDRIKIGWTTDPRTRIATLEREWGYLYPWAVIPGSRADERHLHERWSHRRLDGEWFSANDRMRGFFEKLADEELPA